ncbi:hypothetical protein TYRP_003562 [Tyrophagus putrescentiae]|nr:hypothetical protein TYRP_003562 [Tyrophagus putrescentiae]
MALNVNCLRRRQRSQKASANGNDGSTSSSLFFVLTHSLTHWSECQTFRRLKPGPRKTPTKLLKLTSKCEAEHGKM